MNCFARSYGCIHVDENISSGSESAILSSLAASQAGPVPQRIEEVVVELIPQHNATVSSLECRLDELTKRVDLISHLLAQGSQQKADFSELKGSDSEGQVAFPALEVPDSEGRVAVGASVLSVQQALQEHMKDVAQGLLALNQRIDGLPRNGSSLDVQVSPDADADDYKGEVVTFAIAEKLFLPHSANFEESVWDAALFIGVDIISRADSVLIAVALSLNIFVQLFFCLMANGPMIKDLKLDETEAKAWRETVAHASAVHDAYTGATLVSRVCADDGSLNFATMQTDAVHNILLYMDRFFGENLPHIGVFLQIVVCSVWFLTISIEIVSILKHFAAYVAIPKTRQVTCFALSTDTLVSIRHISKGRAVFIFFLLAVRLAIALFLLFSGAIWLSRTFTIADLVLNASALAFILELDELFFSTMVSQCAQELVRNLQPVPCRHLSYKSVDFKPLVVFVGLVWFSLWVIISEQVPFRDMLQNTMNYLCGGNQEFIYDAQANGKVVFTDAASNTLVVPLGDPPHWARTMITNKVWEHIGDIGHIQNPDDHASGTTFP